MFVFALGNIFAYSLFDTAMPAPYTWFDDTAQWIFGDEEEREKAFFGGLPTKIAPLQVITPPVARIPISMFRSIMDDDYSRLSQYYAWTMFPFGRLARDFSPYTVDPKEGIVPLKGNLVDNPSNVLQKWAGMPLRQIQRKRREWKEEEPTRSKGPKPLWY